MPGFDASALDYVIIAIYFVTVLGVGFLARRLIKTDLDFFLSGRAFPAWITGLAFIAANLGALEILGMAANGAQYGRRDRPLLLDRRDPGHGLPRPGDDAVLIRVEGPLGPGVPPPPVRPRGASVQRALVRRRHRADRRREPVRPRPRPVADARLVDQRGDRRVRRHRAHVHRARRPVVA